MSDNTNLLLRHNYVEVPTTTSLKASSQEDLATILMNLSYYGYALSVESYRAVSKLSRKELTAWWKTVEAELKSITGEDRKIGDFVVYKNFPAEVLEKTAAEYWIPQILMYWGFPNEFFTQEVKPRDKMNEQPRAIVLKKANKNTLKDIFNSYLKAPARWKQQELQDVLSLADQLPINFAKLAFKENLVKLATVMMEKGQKIKIDTATDVLRLAAGLSDGDVSLRTPVKFKSFKKSVRRFLLSTLEGCANLAEDVARRPEMFKRLFHSLHPGDFKRQYPCVVEVYNQLYRGQLTTFNAQVENLLREENPMVLELLSDRPGDFRRRLVHALDLFGNKAVKAFSNEEVLNKLTVHQLVSLRSYLETVNERNHRVFPPKGNWSKVQVADARKVDAKHVKALSKALGQALAERVPVVKVLDDNADLIKLPSNDGEVSPYARGTVFPIPEEVEFIRTASYWKAQTIGYTNIWFDNGWNFFDANWKSLGSCCWTEHKFCGGSAVFSGDPTNSKEMQGRAAQLIDLYPAKLLRQGVRYAVWNILCFSRIPFGKAEDVFAALQWGKDPQSGKLFEPSRCQLQFPLKGESLTKYIALIDLEKREMVYLDANLRGQVQAASSNGATLEKVMPAYMEYINSLPSVHDLFRESVDEESDGAHILYSDQDAELKNVRAYVFKPENKLSKYKPVDLNGLLG
jgi:hypothetical protein